MFQLFTINTLSTFLSLQTCPRNPFLIKFAFLDLSDSFISLKRLQIEQFFSPLSSQSSFAKGISRTFLFEKVSVPCHRLQLFC